MKMFVILLIVVGLVSCSGGESDDCASDVECKGERICSSGTCVDPNGSTANNSLGSDANPITASPGEFGASCEDNDTCNGELLCVYRNATSVGFCSKNCDSISECPSNYDCIVIGNVTRKTCVPEDRLEGCQSTCTDVEAFCSYLDGRKSDCLTACSNASVEKRTQFDTCTSFECSDDCFVALSGDSSPWVTEKIECDRSPQNDDGVCGNANGLPPVAYSCRMEGPEGCVYNGILPGVYCCEE